MKNKDIELAWQGPPQCQQCAVRHLVLFADLEHEDFDLIHKPITEMTFDGGDVFYNPGDKPEFIYTLREGMVKLVQFAPDGSQRIVRLLKQGDVLGLEATVGESYHHQAVAMEPVSVCRIPIAVIDKLSKETPRLHQQLLNRWHKALNTADSWITQLSTGSAQIRVARLLVKLAECHQNTTFFLPGREDIGAMLGITTETASRVTADFKRSGYIKDAGARKVEVDVEALEQLMH